MGRWLGLLVLFANCAVAASQERVRVGDFEIDRHEVTIAQFARFLETRAQVSVAEQNGGGFEYAAGWQRRPGWNFRAPQGKPGEPLEPASHVTWHEAHEYCRWSGGRLPRAEEWKRAAYTEARESPPAGFERGRTYRFPVGDQPDGMNNNRRGHVPVATTREGVNGLYEMGGNVWEWLDDRRGEEALTAGGSWWYGPEQTRAGAFQWKNVDFTALYIGFRCLYPLP